MSENVPTNTGGCNDFTGATATAPEGAQTAAVAS